MHQERYAPGWPGMPPRWTSSAKVGVGAAIQATSHVWFTLSHGILDEVYYPRADQACTRDLGLIVTDGEEFFCEEKRHTNSEVSYLAEGVPAYRLINTDRESRFRIEKEVIADPARDAVVQRCRFVPLKGVVEDYHVHVLLAPHLLNRGNGNTAWVGAYKGVPMLFAQRDGAALALACSRPWVHRSVGFVGFSDGWQDLWRNRRMTWFYTRAENGNVALTGEVAPEGPDDAFVLALGFGSAPAEAGYRALASLQDGFETALAAYQEAWSDWQRTLFPVESVFTGKRDIYRVSLAVLRTHETAHFPGGIIASLSVPWGFARGDDDLGGYHLVWPRDLCEAAGALLAAGALEDCRRVLGYLQATQEEDGHWPQNMWADGDAHWTGVQMDETALPILLVDLARREGALGSTEWQRYYPMVRRAVGYVVGGGPVTQEDRWEEDAGYSPFTLAAEVAALLAAAGMAEEMREPGVARYLRETADAWNEGIERWTYARGTALAGELGVDGYYVRIAPVETAEAATPLAGFVPIKNRPPAESRKPATQILSPDALALVRFGLRAANDPRVVNTVKAVDAVLKVETPCGPAWHRYTGDGYGEHKDGSPFDGTGIGRAWPLLTGERAHYELAAGRHARAQELLAAFEAFTNEGGMLPEQIWDAPDVPERELFFGRPSGSAMPLSWAHAEYVKLRRSIHDGAVFDLPPQTVERYIVRKTSSPFTVWRPSNRVRSMPAGKKLRVEARAPAVVCWSSDGWQSSRECAAEDTGLGIHIADLPTEGLAAGAEVRFRIRREGARFWGKEQSVTVE